MHDLALRIVREAADGVEPVAVLRTGATATNAHAAGYDHYMTLVKATDHVRLLSYPRHPETGRRLDVSFVAVDLAKHVVAFGHEQEPTRYRFLDHLRSSEVLEDPTGVGRKLVEGAARHVRTERHLGDYVHTMSAHVEDMWGELVRGNLRGAAVVAREVAAGCMTMLLEEERGDVQRRGAHEADLWGPAFAERFRQLTAVPDDAPDLVERAVAHVEAMPDRAWKEEPTYGDAERRLLKDVERIAGDLVRRYGDDVRAVGATGSIGRNAATADADYDVHVLLRPRHPDDRHRIDFRLYVPEYPGLGRRGELGFTPTTFLDDLLALGVTTPFSYYHLDHVRHTAMVHDPWGEGRAYQEKVWGVRPPAGFVEGACGRIRKALEATAEASLDAQGQAADALVDECARLLLMRYGLGFVKPKYRAINLDKVAPHEAAFFDAYDRVKGLAGLDAAEARARVRAATELFDLVFETLGSDYRYRCPEMDAA